MVVFSKRITFVSSREKLATSVSNSSIASQGQLNFRYLPVQPESGQSAPPNTGDTEGNILPVKHGPWLTFKSVELVRGQMQPGVGADECLEDIEQ